jgi:hypothetical protein
VEQRHPHQALFSWVEQLLAGAPVPQHRELLWHWADLDNALSELVAQARRYLASELEADRRALEMAVLAAETADLVLLQQLSALTAPPASATALPSAQPAV